MTNPDGGLAIDERIEPRVAEVQLGLRVDEGLPRLPAVAGDGFV